MRSTLLATVPLVLLTGCSGLSGRIQEQVAADDQRASHLVKKVGQVESKGRSAPVVVREEGIWIAKNSIALQKKDQLPPIFYEPATFDRTVYSLAEFAERMTLHSGMPIKIIPDALPIAAAAFTQTSRSNQGSPSGTQALPPPVPGTASPAGTSSGGPANAPVRISYSNGNLKGLLDTATARFGVFWKYVNGSVQIFHTDTRTFQISAIPGDAALNANVSSGSASSNSNGGGTAGGTTGGAGGTSSGTGINSTNTQNTAVTTQLSVFTNIEKSVSSMLSAYGKAVASPATGTITVSDTPDNLERVAKLIEGVNKSLSKQVMINVTVLAVTLNQNDNLGINWNLIYSDLLNRYGIQNTASNAPGSTAFSAGILSTSTSNWAGSSLVISALSDQGQVRRETTASVVTLNNQPVPVQVARQTSYLRSSQTTLTAVVGSSTTLTPGVITSGFNMTLLPHLLEDGTVMLQFSTDISSLRGIRTVTSNSSSIETPELDTRNFLQRVAMKSNDTLIISGFEQTDGNIYNRGTAHPDNILFGGNRTATSNKEVIVILITPITVGAT
ncbi:MAG TPA: PilN family type IVB pilus formation outer membrane protein [Noviherbaspirillum sp.]|nr:PilN family type IVB pilus formation outer membrane protein [Noviherbaspirillum sp.]